MASVILLKAVHLHQARPWLTMLSTSLIHLKQRQLRKVLFKMYAPSVQRILHWISVAMLYHWWTVEERKKKKTHTKIEVFWCLSLSKINHKQFLISKNTWVEFPFKLHAAKRIQIQSLPMFYSFFCETILDQNRYFDYIWYWHFIYNHCLTEHP